MLRRSDASKEGPGGGAPLRGREARLLRQEHDVAGDALCVKQAGLGADGVEPRALGVARRRVVAEGRLLRPSPGREHEEEVVLEEEHVVGARLERLQRRPAGGRRGEDVARAPRLGQRRR